MTRELHYEVRWEDWDGNGTVAIWQDADEEWQEPVRIVLSTRDAMDRLNELVDQIRRECDDYAMRR